MQVSIRSVTEAVNDTIPLDAFALARVPAEACMSVIGSAHQQLTMPTDTSPIREWREQTSLILLNSRDILRDDADRTSSRANLAARRSPASSSLFSPPGLEADGRWGKCAALRGIYRCDPSATSDLYPPSPPAFTIPHTMSHSSIPALALGLSHTLVGVGSLLAPLATASLFALPAHRPTAFITRLFGSRDLLLGLAVVTSEERSEKRRWALGVANVVNAIDVISALVGYAQGDVTDQGALLGAGGAALLLLLGVYAQR
ncbi:hypothetical protein DB88DRAFT_483238 [Papiliotrema laurentii]|uniref:Uncharacterized protein n=1 Tax=Papiliotrema laurentii TaxID=5418 RepID=A0AAD9FV68_PAPLA|nr:hypothetical protein DB88DRAFT_483238 [Papiliotrema laurentii]